ncbi:hypothetical protein [Streptomyces sp. NPDC094032]|uniref:hypothetical protein n=1 Tax=Streptomyces sp. NPDC094032 TaxID=3155308 RepID=UPI003328DB4E
MTNGHDMTPPAPPAVPGTLRLRLDPWGTHSEVKLRVSPEIAVDLLRELKGAGGDAGERQEFGAMGELIVLGLIIRDNGGWMTLRTAIEALANRNKDKHIRLEFGEAVLEMDGYSAKEVERLLGPVRESFDEAATRWQQFASQQQDTSELEPPTSE